MRALASLLLAAVALAATAPAGLASTHRSHAHARKPPRPPPAPLPPAPIPPDLLALGQKMGELKPSSERFRLTLELAEAGAQFNFDLSGEAGSSPPAAALKLAFLGHTVTVRVVNERDYLYEPAIARRDHGRPWIDFGRRGLAGLGGGPAGVDLSSGAGVTSFKHLVMALGGARRITELGPGMIDGQAVTGFRATVALSSLEEPAPVANSKPTGIFAPIGLGSSAREPPGFGTLELFIAPSGLPVQTRIRAREEGAAITVSYDIYAVDFPVSVQAPPKRQTISAAALRALDRKRRTASLRRAGAEREDRPSEQ